jgi:TetR/AcrR family transcriptional regulator, cholesterol catabolism regulator
MTATARAMLATVARDARKPTVRPPRRTQEMIDAAAQVFAEKGYHGASTQDIADRLGIRQASLYYYFASKEAALELVCARGVEGYFERSKAIAAQSGSSADKLRALILQHLSPMLDRPHYVRVFQTQRQFLPEPSRRRIGGLARQYEQVLQRVIDEGIRAGEFRNDIAPQHVMLTLLGACNAATAWQGVISGMTVQLAADTIFALMLNGVKREPRRSAARG